MTKLAYFPMRPAPVTRTCRTVPAGRKRSKARSRAGPLATLIERNGLRHPVLVGDTPGDQAAARACGVPFLDVDYGFADCEDADHRFSSFGHLTGWLLGQPPRMP